MDRVSVSPGGPVTAALQQERLILADRPKTALVPYCSEGSGPVWNKEELISFVAKGNGNTVFFFRNPRLNLAPTFLESQVKHGQQLQGALSFYIKITFSPEGELLGRVLSLARHVFPVGKHPFR